MNYLWREFGNFKPHIDRDASIRFALSMLLMDGHSKELLALLSKGGTVSGEPGWTIECTNCLNNMNIGACVNFSIYVDEKGYELAYPEMNMSARMFYEYLSAAMESYLKDNPSDESCIREIMEICTSRVSLG